MHKLCERLCGGLKQRQKTKASRFGRDEDGSVIVFTLFILVLMLVVSGMAVDFMRFESRRSMLQGTVDRAVLAAADLDQTLDPAAVVQDYFDINGFGDALVGTPAIVDDGSYRSVSATGVITLDTYFLRLIGMDTMNASATSTAIEGVGNIEVSLVLDVSGSMYKLIPGTSVRRIERLRQAATSFVDTLLKPEFDDKISVSLVPYSEHVNIGPDLFGAINTTNIHDYSHCVEIPAAEYTTTSFNAGITYEQTQAWQSNTWGQGGFAPQTWDSTRDANNPDLDQPFCPRFNYEQIIPLTQNKNTLNNAIAQFQPRAGTSIFLGLKWATTLLDPSFNATLGALPFGVIDAVFADRPAAYPLTNLASETKKYIVLMTDGQNDKSDRLRPQYYDTLGEIDFWAANNFVYNFYHVYGGGSYTTYRNTYVEPYYTIPQGDGYMQSMCDAAKDKNIIVYSVAMSVGDNSAGAVRGRGEMQDCASSPGHYFETSGQELVQIFDAIASQITDLRLTQ